MPAVPAGLIYRVLGAGRVEVFEDDTQDKFSATRDWLVVDQLGFAREA